MLLFTVLPLPAAAKESWDFETLGFEGVFAALCERYALDEENFGMGWQDLTSGECWYFDGDGFQVGGSMYKLPLNMALQDSIDNGTIEDSPYIERLRRESIVRSSNEAAQELRQKLSPNDRRYRESMAAYSGYRADELPMGYWRDNEFSPRFMLNTLLVLYEDERYAPIIDWMKEATPNAYFRKEQGEYPIAHKYGSFEGALCDCGILFTPRPFLLVAMTDNVNGASALLSEISHMMVAYSLYLDAEASPALAEERWEDAAILFTSGAAAAPQPPLSSAKPRKREWLLSFAGDCTIGTLHEWQGRKNASNMLHVMGEDYSYPFSLVASYLQTDDLTIVNLEGAFTDETACKQKAYRFRASPRYAEVLTAGGIDAVTLANNHSGDYLAKGLSDTQEALDEHGVLWTDAENGFVTELEGGLRVGVVSFNAVEIDLAVGDVDDYMARMAPVIDAVKAEGCDILIAYIHWGWEYRTSPERWMVDFAHRLVDAGCSLVLGSHAHVLQPCERYEGAPIFYGLGNFCFGGHDSPRDRDSVIVQQRIVLDDDGHYTLGETSIIPCSISSGERLNNFCPMPYEEGSAEYERVLQKICWSEFPAE